MQSYAFFNNANEKKLISRKKVAPMERLFDVFLPLLGLPSEERIVLHQLVDLGADGVDLGLRSGLGLRIDVADDVVNQFDDDGHLVLLQTTGGDGGRTDAQTRGQERRAGVEGHHVLVDGDVGKDEGVLHHLTGDLRELAAEVDQHGVVVGATADDIVTLIHESSGHEGGVLSHLLDVLHVLVAEGFAESNGLGGDDVLQRSTLDAREHGAVDLG